MKISFEQLVRDLAEKQLAFAEAEKETQSARSAETAALNSLNQAQKCFDEAVLVLKKSAPGASNWAPRHMNAVG